MGLVSPLHNVKGQTLRRPPITVFVICLLLFACTILAMGFFIQYTNTTVLNPEVKGKWIQFLNHLSSMELCVSEPEGKENLDPESIAQFIDGDGLNSTDDDSITISASLQLLAEIKKLPPGRVAAYGKIGLGDWAVLRDDKPPLQSMKMAFVIPPNLTETSSKNSCVVLAVPPTFLPLSMRPSVCVPSFLNKTVTNVRALTVFNGTNETFCKTGVSLQLSYGRKSEQEFYLSKLEKWNIYLRLIHTSYFLFGVIVVLVCFTLLRTRSYQSVVTIDKMPLNL